MPRKKKEITTKAAETTKPETVDAKTKKRVRHSYIYAVGRRKKAIARTRLFKSGSGKITINNKELAQYFVLPKLQNIVTQPLVVVSQLKSLDFSVRAQGGGINGQAVAVAHGIARALIKLDKDFKPLLRAQGMTTRDPRRKERKKPGLKRARRAPQFSKR